MNEILAPCGGAQSLPAALNTGADAVYVGMKRFSARKNAENFSDEELAEAARECHKRGVKLYVTLNTLIYDDEIEDFAECVKTAAQCGADGLIIQDLGAAYIA
ncbi:MAG: U32 family peptidase, partial [Oscillospiraceae bacterium]|nr:U32 family peptidase [Oscillospiraceae bacterium]